MDNDNGQHCIIKAYQRKSNCGNTKIKWLLIKSTLAGIGKGDNFFGNYSLKGIVFPAY